MERLTNPSFVIQVLQCVQDTENSLTQIGSGIRSHISEYSIIISSFQIFKTAFLDRSVLKTLKINIGLQAM